jgi:hypothetical protein
MQVFIVHQFNRSQSDIQRPLGCAQAPDIFGFGDFPCFAAMAGHVDAAARTAAIAILTTNLMEGPRKYRPKRN